MMIDLGKGHWVRAADITAVYVHGRETARGFPWLRFSQEHCLLVETANGGEMYVPYATFHEAMGVANRIATQVNTFQFKGEQKA